MGLTAIFTKVDDAPDGLAIEYGRATAERVDCNGEIASYPETKRAYQQWSRDTYDVTSRSGAEPSYGNVRKEHAPEIFGKLIKPPKYRDPDREIWVTIKAADRASSRLLREATCPEFPTGAKWGAAGIRSAIPTFPLAITAIRARRP